MSTIVQPTVEVREFSPRRVLGVRHIGAYNDIGQAFKKLSAWASEQNILGPTTEMIGLYYDDPEKTPVERLRSDACVSAPAGAVDQRLGDGQVQVIGIEGGRYAVATYRGPYSGLPDAWRCIYHEWLEQNHARPRPLPPFEIYLNDPCDTKPEDLLTEICVPIH